MKRKMSTTTIQKEPKEPTLSRNYWKLVKATLPDSTSTHHGTALGEWEHARFHECQNTGRCVCGKRGIVEHNTIVHRLSGQKVQPIGSACIQYFPEELRLQFKEAKGHFNVPRSFKLKGFRLGLWVGTQRANQDSLSPERKQRLDDIGFVWDMSAEKWEVGFSKLLQFKEAEGHCRVPKYFELDGYKLGEWVSIQRKTPYSMADERKQRLDAIDFAWDPLAHRWEVGFDKLLQFKQSEGHCRVPQRFQMEEFKLGRWVGIQRSEQENLSTERKQRLDDIGFVWDPLTQAWEDGFKKLLQFRETEGHCRVPIGFKLDGFSLGFWVSNQRRAKDKSSAERKQRLDEIGFIWDMHKDKT